MAVHTPNGRALRAVKKLLRREPIIKSARAYGSSLYKADSLDVDIAVLIPSRKGVVDPDVYRRLRSLRSKCVALTKTDIDLVPHTDDEIHDGSSPLWWPKHYPSLACGFDIKGRFPVRRFRELDRNLSARAAFAAFVLHETRTITRREVIQANSNEEKMRIFIAKLLHGPGNALTYFAEHENRRFDIDPANIAQAFARLDELLGLCSEPVIRYFSTCAERLKKDGTLPFSRVLTLLNWYESLVATILEHDVKALFRFTSTLSSPRSR